MLDSIRLLRGIAVVSVMAFHFRTELSVVNSELASLASYGGTYGVSLFFVISGFVITRATDGVPVSFRGFMIRRLFRIIPLASLATLITWGVKHWLGWGAIEDRLTLLSSLLFLPLNNQDPPFYGYRVQPVQWTLTYELVFYAVFSLALMVKTERHYRWVVLFLMTMVFGLQAVYGSVTLNAYASPLVDGNSPLYGLLSLLANPIFLLFIVGIALARGYVWFERASVRAIHLGCGVLAISFINWMLAKFFDVLVVAVSVWTFFLVLLSERFIHSKCWMKGFNRLGDISYSLYLVHPIVYLVYYSLKSRLEYDVDCSPVGFWLLVSVSVALSALSYRWIEKPGIRIGKQASIVAG